MSSANPHYCFESESQRDLFVLLYPQHRGNSYTLEEFLPLYGYPALNSPEIRLKRLGTFTDGTDPEGLDKLLHTLENLRLSIVLNLEQCLHLFSVLPNTPKNQQLKLALDQYLQSDLTQDLPHQLWDAAGKFKMKELAPQHSPIYFVRAPRSSYLFGEFANAYAEATVGTQPLASLESKCIEFWECQTKSEVAAKTKIYLGDPTRCLDEIANRIKLRQTPETKVYVAFAGATNARHYLSFKLDSLNILYQSLFADEAQPNSVNATVLIFPFQAIPIPADSQIVTYVDETLFESQNELLLTEHELETLDLNGFNIPRRSTNKDYIQRMLLNFLSLGPKSTFYSSLPLSALTEVAEAGEVDHIHIPSPLASTDPKQTGFANQHFPFQGKLSATQLKAYHDCPAKYFTGYRLNLRKSLTPEESFYLLLGQLTHLCLERHLKETRQPLDTLFIEALSALQPLMDPKSPLAIMLYTAYQKMARHFTLLETHLRENLGVTENIDFEQSFTLELSTDDTDADLYRFNGKMDRVVRNRDGNILVLDYKTGNVDFTPNHVSQGKDFQALLYVLAAQKQHELAHTLGIAYYDLKEGEIKRGLLREELLTPEQKKLYTRGHVLPETKFTPLIEQGTHQMLEVAKAIFSGNVTPTPEPGVCERCDAVIYCRAGADYV